MTIRRNMLRNLLWATLLGVGLRAAPACALEPLRVAVSVPPLAWFVEELGGDAVRIEVALPTGASPASYDPTPRSLARLADCALLVCVGVPMEEALVPALRSIVPDLMVVNAADGVAGVAMAHDHHHGHGHHHADDAPDPHIWLSPRRAPALMANIAAALIEVRPDLAARIALARPALEDEFALLDRDLASLLEESTRPVVVHHPSFGYLSADYGLRTLVVERAGLSPTARYLGQVMDEITASGATGLVVQPQFADGQVRKAAEMLGLRIVDIDPLARNLPANLRLMAARLAVLSGTRGRTP